VNVLNLTARRFHAGLAASVITGAPDKRRRGDPSRAAHGVGPLPTLHGLVDVSTMPGATGKLGRHGTKAPGSVLPREPTKQTRFSAMFR